MFFFSPFFFLELKHQLAILHLKHPMSSKRGHPALSHPVTVPHPLSFLLGVGTDSLPHSAEERFIFLSKHKKLDVNWKKSFLFLSVQNTPVCMYEQRKCIWMFLNVDECLYHINTKLNRVTFKKFQTCGNSITPVVYYSVLMGIPPTGFNFSLIKVKNALSHSEKFPL